MFGHLCHEKPHGKSHYRGSGCDCRSEHIADGRQFLLNSDGRYDVAIVDRRGNATSSGMNRNMIETGNNGETKICTPLDTYPVDTWTLTSAFPSKDVARAYLKRHWETWVTEHDIAKIASAGLIPRMQARLLSVLLPVIRVGSQR